MGFLAKILSNLSGTTGLKVSEQLLYDKVIGFKGVVNGCGNSTLVQNVAIALSNSTNYSICVVDANYIAPTMYPMLVNSPDSKRKDFLDYDGDLTELVINTNFRNVYLLSMYNRGILDMLSAKDSEITAEKLIGALKSYYDIVLIDLSNEPTNISTHMAIKCNKIYNIADQSLKSIYNLRKSLNTMSTLAVPVAKSNKIILNKMVPDVLSNTSKVVEESGLKIIGQIPLSLSIAKQGVSGQPIWTSKTTDPDILVYSDVVNKILQDIVQVTPLNANYTNPEKVKEAKMSWLERRKLKKQQRQEEYQKELEQQNKPTPPSEEVITDAND